MKYQIKAYPNGEVNASIVREKPLEPLHISHHSVEDSRIVMATVRAVGIALTVMMIAEGKIYGVAPATLCLSTVPILRKPKGSSGLTRHGRRQIECGTQLLERHCRRDCLSFLTLTLPDSAAKTDNFIGFAKAKNRFTTWLTRQLKKNGITDLYVGVVEPHPNRSRNQGRLIPHYHLCFQGRRNGRPWILSPTAIKEAWFRCLFNEGLCEAEGDSSACANVQRVKKSVGRYMSKYLAKTRSTTKEESPEVLSKVHPGTWHIISRSLVTLIKQSIKHRFGIAAETILDFLAIPGNPWVLYRGDVTVTGLDGTEYWVGSYAKVTQECLAAI